MAKIEAPNTGYNGRIGDVVFKDGVADTDNQAVIQYCRGAGYTVDGEAPGTPDHTPPIDSRDVEVAQVGSRLRDSAVDPQPGDFLPPVNAGKADPHGPEVVAPGIHAVSGPGPIVPGPVGRFERDEDGSQVVITDTAEQQRRETTAAEKVFLERRSVPEVTAELGDQAQPVDAGQADAPAGNASAEDWRTYAVDQHGADPERVAGMKRDDLRAEFGPKAE